MSLSLRSSRRAWCRFGCHTHITKTRGKQLNPPTGVFPAGADVFGCTRDKKTAVALTRRQVWQGIKGQVLLEGLLVWLSWSFARSAFRVTLRGLRFRCRCAAPLAAELIKKGSRCCPGWCLSYQQVFINALLNTCVYAPCGSVSAFKVGFAIG